MPPNRFIDHLFKQRHKELATGKRGKDRKERNLASSQDKVSRDSHHHGSSGIPSVGSSCVHWWWGSLQWGFLHCLVAQPFIRCSGRLFPRPWHVPRITPVACMCFFLSPGSSRLGRGPVPRHILVWFISEVCHQWHRV